MQLEPMVSTRRGSARMSSHDIFVCFSSKDDSAARDVVRRLEARALKCWISSRDVRPGQNYQEAIVEALQTAKIIVFLLSEFSNSSGEIRKELSLASSFGAAVIPLRLTAVMPTGALRYELATRQWIDAFPDREEALDRVADAAHQVLTGGADGAEDESAAPDRVAPLRSWGEAMRPPPPAAGSRPTRAPIVSTGSAEFDAIRMLLARHVGPIAKILVEKAAADARSVDDFCERLAAHVAIPADRTAFLKAVRQRVPARA
jgi:TIR domain